MPRVIGEWVLSECSKVRCADIRSSVVLTETPEFERSRVFRPRLLIRGVPGMGQQYLAGALLNHFEGLHVQSFDLPTLLSDSTRVCCVVSVVTCLTNA